jgi:hypothetical protein
MSKQDDFQTFGSAFQQFLHKSGMKDRFDEKQVLASWQRVVGKVIAKKTKRIWIKNAILFVEFDRPLSKAISPFIKQKYSKYSAKNLAPRQLKTYSYYKHFSQFLLKRRLNHNKVWLKK